MRIGQKESTGGRKAGCSIRICLVPWERGQRAKMGHSRKSATELGIRMGNWILRNGEERGDDLQFCYLLPWSERPVGSQEMPAGFVSWTKAMCEAGS